MVMQSGGYQRAERITDRVIGWLVATRGTFAVLAIAFAAAFACGVYIGACIW